MFGWTIYTKFKDVKGILIGEDKLYKDSDGLCYSRLSGAKSELVNNLFSRLYQLNILHDIPKHGSLVKWASQGLLIINKIGCYDPVNIRSWILNPIVTTIIETMLYYLNDRNLIIISIGKGANSWDNVWKDVENKFKQRKKTHHFPHNFKSILKPENITNDMCRQINIKWNHV